MKKLVLLIVMISLTQSGHALFMDLIRLMSWKDLVKPKTEPSAHNLFASTVREALSMPDELKAIVPEPERFDTWIPGEFCIRIARDLLFETEHKIQLLPLLKDLRDSTLKWIQTQNETCADLAKTLLNAGGLQLAIAHSENPECQDMIYERLGELSRIEIKHGFAAVPTRVSNTISAVPDDIMGSTQASFVTVDPTKESIASRSSAPDVLQNQSQTEVHPWWWKIPSWFKWPN